MWTDVAKRLVADGQSDGKVNGALLVVNYLLRGGSVHEPLQSDRSPFLSKCTACQFLLCGEGTFNVQKMGT